MYSPILGIQIGFSQAASQSQTPVESGPFDSSWPSFWEMVWRSWTTTWRYHRAFPAFFWTAPRAQLSLAEHLAEVPDLRYDQGTRHSLAAILTLVAAAILCGMRSLQAISQFGRALSKQDAARGGSGVPAAA